MEGGEGRNGIRHILNGQLQS